MSTLQGKVAIVTGPSQGIGRAIAEQLGKEGASVLIDYRQNQQEAEQVVKVIEQQGGKAQAVQADISHVPDIVRLFETCLSTFGRPNILVANAGIVTLGPLTEISEEEFDRVFSLNAKGTLFSLREAAKHLQDGGRVVLTSSSTTFFPTSGAYIYAGSKATIKMYTEIAAQDLGGRGITVNSVVPGVIETSLATRLPQEFKDSVTQSSPFKRLGQPQDIADVVAFLVSDEARWVTGQEILVNGGAKQ